MVDGAAGESQRGFLQRLWDGAVAMGAGLLRDAPTEAFVPQDFAALATLDTRPAVTHLPRTLEELASLPIQDKLLLSAATASGCDAVAYYQPDERGQLTLSQQIDLYPERHTAFAPTLSGFNPGTFASEDAVASHATYHIPVHVTDQHGRPGEALRGVMVLHAPAEGYSRVQTEAEQAKKGDMHEPVYVRKAKLDMAAHIVERHQDMLGGRSFAELVRRGKAAVHHRTLDERIDYFTQLAKDMFATFTRSDHAHPDASDPVRNARNARELVQSLRDLTRQYDSRQAQHVLSVTDLMRLSVDALNKDQPQPVVNPKQAELVELITLLHDVGKTQMSSQFFKPWESRDPQEAGAIKEYGLTRNHNHPLFTLVTMLLYPQEGITAGSHHHGLFRYSTEELEGLVGPDSFSKRSILLDNLPESELPALSRVMRVADVTGAMTDDGKTLAHAILELADKAGYDAATRTVKPLTIAPGTIDPDCLCFMIDNGLFKAYGEQRERQEREAGKPGWVNKEGAPQYDPAAVEAAGQSVLAAFGWQQKKEQVSAQLRREVADDKVLRDLQPRAISAELIGGRF